MKYKKNFYQIRSNQQIWEELKGEIETVGYYRLPLADTTEIRAHAKRVEQQRIVVVGIGGSSLGARAVYAFLRHKKKYAKTLSFLETTDPVQIMATLDAIDPEETHFVLISKSGTTVETIATLKYLSHAVTLNATNTTVISGHDTPLHRYAQTHNMPFFELNEDVGGRFSVLSVVGLVPLAMVGVDIDNMLRGAHKVYESFFRQERFYDILMEKGRFFVENKHRFNINVLFSYSSALEGFNKWYVQLWAESLGKININGTRQGLTPIGLIGPVDQHSFLQLIMEGVRDKTITFIKVADFEETIFVPRSSPIPELASLEGISFSKLIDLQADATIQAIAALKTIPYDVITIDKVDEYNIAELMYSYQLLVSIIGAFLQIETYDQPGVEAGKKILKGMLGA